MTRSETVEERVARHYTGGHRRGGLENAIIAALAAAGKDPDHLSPSDLAPVDEFHTGGREATVDFAAQLAVAPGTRLLDVGCGIGGAARFFADRFGCRVTGVDLTEEFVRTARALSRRVGLGDRVRFEQANALALPFEPGSFDAAYMMHVGMNVEDKPALFREIRRVLAREGSFGIYDVVLTGRGAIRFPLPCATGPETCFVTDTGTYRRALAEAGFEIRRERDRLEVARAFFRRELGRLEQSAGAPPPLGIHLLLGDEAPRILANVVELFERGTLAPIELICRRRD
jgi:SAM-dependent methyltransferase